MAIDFTLSPELETIRLRVAAFIDQVVQPGEAKIGDPEEIERAEYIKLLFGMRERGEGRRALAARTCRRSGAAWGSATSSSRWSRPRRRRPPTARSC